METSVKCYIRIFLAGLSEVGVHPPILENQLTLSQQGVGGIFCLPYYFDPTPRFLDLPTAWSVLHPRKTFRARAVRGWYIKPQLWRANSRTSKIWTEQSPNSIPELAVLLL